MSIDSDSVQASTSKVGNGPAIWLGVITLIYVLLVGVSIIGAGFKWVSGGEQGAAAIFAFASNPIAGVILGVLATALVQSSSTVTSVIVGLVAGGVPVSVAVPMIMGANMGTTITNTIVSLGNAGQSGPFNKSFQAATVHDFFNLYSIFIFLPIEILFRPLERMAGASADWLVGDGGTSVTGLNFIGAVTKPVAKALVETLQSLPTAIGGSLAIAIGIGLIIFSVVYLGRLLRSVMTGHAKEIVEKAVGRSPETGVMSGTMVTVLVQSSSTTTSLIVPLAGAGVVTTRQVFPFTMGANIGTCITALLAATSISGPNEEFALQIALVHLFYNVLGVLLFLYTPVVKDLPVKAAVWLGEKAGQHRAWAFGYIFALFFVLPGTVFGGGVLFDSAEENILRASDSPAALQCTIDVQECEMVIE